MTAAELAVVRRIFSEYVSGRGFKSIAHGLNAHHVLGPRGRAWDSGNVRSILRREAYRGELSYGKTKKRNKLGDRQKQRQTTWETIEHPDLRIVSEKLAHEVDAKLKGRRTSAGGRPTEPMHLLSA
ncbi:MAG: hypothetical protein DMF96_08305 [Acidobacteria bacterium]|nr:MAG: hypothetical protein DMF96_08305 [Acidobacteriota bacterium]